MKNFGFIQKIRFKRAISYFTLLALVVFFVFAVSTNLIGNIARTKALDLHTYDNIYQTDTFDYSGQSVNIVGNVQIDGEHTFGNLTVKNGGSLTSTDYNKYGISDGLGLVEKELLKNDNDWRYGYVMRGFINTGTVHNSVYSVTDGQTTSGTVPDSLYADDYASIEFFSAVAADSVYDPAIWSTLIVGANAYSDVHHVKTQFTDNLSDASHPFIPFELRMVNTGGYSDFGITSCAVGTCGTTANNTFIKTLSSSTPFTSSATPELKSFVAWQGDADQSFSTISNYATLSSYFLHLFNAGYADYYRADSYDFANDKKMVLETNTDILTNPTIVNSIDQYENVVTVGTNYRGYANFYPEPGVDEISPLASRRTEFPTDNGTYIDYGFPIISQALYTTFRNNGAIIKPAVLTVKGTFTVEAGGSVILDAKGFNASGVYKGAGPGGGNGENGASHAGLGGDGGSVGGLAPPATYDNTMSEPRFPGSGAFTGYNGDLSRSFLASQYHYGDGGGFIKIVAEGKIVLKAGSMVRANAVNGNSYTDNPRGAASGGSIVLIDNNASSEYNSLITVMGGWCHDSPGGGRCTAGGGGGGYIFISSKADLTYLESRKNYFRSFPDPTSVADTFPPDFYTSSGYGYSWWMNTLGIPQVMLSASGGRAQSDDDIEVHRGKPGIINIAGGSAAYKLKKKLVAVERKGATPITNFNPYALQLDDIIRVEIEVAQVADGSKITDNILKVPNSNSRCEPTINTPIPTGTITAGVSVEWTKAANSPSVFSYQCRVVQ